MSRDMRESEKKFLLKIVDLYKHMRFLWDKSDGDYLNRQKRLEGFEILLEIYNQFDPDANVTALKKKLENMRTTYNRELKKVNASKGTSEPYTPSLWYYDAFCFLQESEEQYQYEVDTFNSFEEGSRPSSPDSNSKEALEEQPQELQNQHASKRLLESLEKEDIPALSKKKQRMNLIQEEEYLDAAQRFMNEEAWEIIGKAIGIQLKDLEKRQLAIAQKIISDAIFYAKLEKLTEDSFISLTANKLNR